MGRPPCANPAWPLRPPNPTTCPPALRRARLRRPAARTAAIVAREGGVERPLAHALVTLGCRLRDGDEPDIDACVEALAACRAGLPLNDALYQLGRPARRNMAIMLLVDASGSTDAWIGGERHIIDVEREALLLVSIALQGLAEPYAIEAFSGLGTAGVTLRTLKRFDEAYGDLPPTAAGLEPDRYTRTGAALRHALHC